MNILEDDPAQLLGSLRATVNGAPPQRAFVATLVFQQFLAGGEMREGEVAMFRGVTDLDGVARFDVIGLLDAGSPYELEIVFGEDQDPAANSRCRLQLTAPNTGDLVIEEDFASLTCDSERGREPFFDCAR